MSGWKGFLGVARFVNLPWLARKKGRARCARCDLGESWRYSLRCGLNLKYGDSVPSLQAQLEFKALLD